MVNDQLLAYIRQQLAAGAAKDALKEQLVKGGWSAQDIEDTFRAHENPQMPTPPVAGAAGAGTGTLPGGMELLKEAWAFYKSRVKPLTLIALISYVILPLIAGSLFSIGFVAVGITGLATQSPAAIIAAVVVGIVLIVLFGLFMIWSNAAMLYATVSDTPLGVGASYGRGRRMLLAFVWLAFLSALIVGGGFTLLLIPGIIFAAWFSLAQFALVAEGDRGFAALLKSREYVRGYFSPVLWRIAFAFLIYAVAAIALSLIEKIIDISVSGAVSGFIHFILHAGLTLVGTPLLICYSFMLYRALKTVKGVPSIAGKSRAPYIIVGVLGIALLVTLFTGAAYFLSYIDQPSSLYPDLRREDDIKELQYGLLLYIDSAHDTYPTSLDALVPDEFSNLPTDPVTKQPYEYTLSSDGTSYKICATLENGSPVCVSDSLSNSTDASSTTQ